MAQTTTGQLLTRVIKLGAALIGAIAVLGGIIGFLVAGLNGLLSALVGAGIALVFVSLTAITIKFGASLPLGGFFGLVMGGWLLKLVGFIVVIATLKGAAWVDGKVLFFTIVASILGSLALDAVLVAKSRIPTYDAQ
jgi:hypothetical protein